MPNAVGQKSVYVPGLTGAYGHIQENQTNARTLANPQGQQPMLGALGTHSAKGGGTLGGQNTTQNSWCMIGCYTKGYGQNCMSQTCLTWIWYWVQYSSQPGQPCPCPTPPCPGGFCPCVCTTGG